MSIEIYDDLPYTTFLCLQVWDWHYNVLVYVSQSQISVSKLDFGCIANPPEKTDMDKMGEHVNIHPSMQPHVFGMWKSPRVQWKPTQM